MTDQNQPVVEQTPTETQPSVQSAVPSSQAVNQPPLVAYQLPGDTMGKGKVPTRSGFGLAGWIALLAVLLSGVAILLVVTKSSANVTANNSTTAPNGTSTSNSNPSNNTLAGETTVPIANTSMTAATATPIPTAVPTEVSPPTATPAIGLLVAPANPQRSVAYVGSVVGVPLTVLADDASNVSVSITQGVGSLLLSDKDDCSGALSSAQSVTTVLVRAKPALVLYCPPDSIPPKTFGIVNIRAMQTDLTPDHTAAESVASLQLRSDDLALETNQRPYDVSKAKTTCVPFTLELKANGTQLDETLRSYRLIFTYPDGFAGTITYRNPGNNPGNEVEAAVPLNFRPGSTPLCYNPPPTEDKNALPAAHQFSIAFENSSLGHQYDAFAFPVVAVKVPGKLRKTPRVEDNNLVMDEGGDPSSAVIPANQAVVVIARAKDSANDEQWVRVRFNDSQGNSKEGWMAVSALPKLDLISLPVQG